MEDDTFHYCPVCNSKFRVAFSAEECCSIPHVRIYLEDCLTMLAAAKLAYGTKKQLSTTCVEMWTNKVKETEAKLSHLTKGEHNDTCRA